MSSFSEVICNVLQNNTPRSQVSTLGGWSGAEAQTDSRGDIQDRTAFSTSGTPGHPLQPTAMVCKGQETCSDIQA